MCYKGWSMWGLSWGLFVKLGRELNYVILIKLNINFYEIIGCIYKGKCVIICILYKWY